MEKEDERWAQVMETLDLLFSKVVDIDKTQMKLETQFEMSAKVMEQVLKDQQVLGKQMEMTA